jgi:hypothetical protein
MIFQRNDIKLMQRMRHSSLKSKLNKEIFVNNSRNFTSSFFSEMSFAAFYIQIFLLFLISISFIDVNAYCQMEQQTLQIEKPTKLSSSMPVIGGLCRLDSADVNIGGKQTHFFLRCEPITESAPGEGVWVVKSRNIGSAAPRVHAATLVKSEQHIRRTTPKMSIYICDLVADTREHGYCSVSENCLQPIYTDRNSFLQCDSTYLFI